MEETWTNRELPVLRYLVECFDDPDVHRVDLSEISAATGLDDEQVRRALRALSEASPDYIHGRKTAQTSYPVLLTGVTERARRDVGVWPTPDSLVDRLVTAFDVAADQEPDPERQGRLRQIARSLGGSFRDIAVQVAGTAVARSVGM